MIWLSWRQHRLELLVTLALGLGIAGAMTVVTFQIQPALAALQHACSATPPGPLCQPLSQDFGVRFAGLSFLFYVVLLVLPGLAGVFIGAPLLAREFEQGTSRLVWTQGITRFRWLGIQIGLILAFAIVVSTLVALVGARMVWIDTVSSRWNSFDIQGPAFVAYAIFAIALGTAAGGLIRRTVPAMAVTLVVFVAIRVAVLNWVRPNFLPPLEFDTSQTVTAGGDSWNLGQKVVDLSGHAVSQQYYEQLVANAGSLPGSMGDYLRAHGVVLLQLYQPESRYWLFQSLEATLFVALAAALIGVVIWSIRRA